MAEAEEENKEPALVLLPALAVPTVHAQQRK